MYQMKVMNRKQGEKDWTVTYTSTDKEHVLEMLAEDLVAHYIGKARYVKSIKRTQNYDGTATYTVDHTLADYPYQKQKTEYIVPIYC